MAADINNVNYFDVLYVNGQPRMRVSLEGSEKFGALKDTRKFTDQEKSDYIDELMERRSLRDARRAAKAMEILAGGGSARSFSRGDKSPADGSQRRWNDIPILPKTGK